MENKSRERKRSKVEIAARAAATALALTSLSGIENIARAEGIRKDPNTIRLEEQLQEIDRLVQDDLNKGKKGAYHRDVVFQGGMSVSTGIGRRVVDPQTGNVGYDQLVEYKRPGHKLPFFEMIIKGAPTRKYQYGEHFTAIKILTRNENNPNLWIEQDAHQVANGKWTKNQFFKYGNRYTVQINSSKEMPIGVDIAVRNFDSFSEDANSIIFTQDDALAGPPA